MEEKYRKIFFRYLFRILDLKNLEDYLMSNGINYIASENNMCNEEKTCYAYSKYFYLLNEINLLMLNEEEMMYLRVIKSDGDLSERTINFIKNTYRKVMFSNSRGRNKYYGAISESFMAKDNQIVLGLKRDEMGFSAHKLKTMEEIQHDDIIISQVIKKIEENKYNIDIKVITYNELFEKHKRGN